ncbi:MAG: monovalent cation:H+ antiporter-2, family [Thermomicrobiales bacterium]|jgi:CPA2 family monovalent cation:H+ antiporter-2|nr:monovalent cation:H+ antiporter-2, family [Thermomicrobiales bacterium]
MPHDTTLIATLAVGLTAALIGGIVAARLRLPPLVGYLLAGVAVGPFTPGFVADAHLAPQLAEVGVILLMFGVGIHFSPVDLLSVRRLALPGAIGQVAAATILGIGLSHLWGWTVGEGLVFGLALSVASTVVLLRALEARGAVQAPDGRVAVGWLIVEDLVMVLALVLLPALAEPLGGTAVDGSDRSLGVTLALTLGKVVIFGVLMLVAGVRIIPWLLGWIERTGSRELFVLATLAAALGIAYGASELFGVSFALGAFLAGVVVNESEFSHRAAEEALPLREAFAVLFFVSVGMLIDPSFLVDNLGRVLAVAAVIVVGKAIAAIVIVRALGGPSRTGLTVAAGLAQVGEFSFILAELGIGLNLLPPEGRDLILAGALVSITVNPLAWRLADSLAASMRARRPAIART